MPRKPRMLRSNNITDLILLNLLKILYSGVVKLYSRIMVLLVSDRMFVRIVPAIANVQPSCESYLLVDYYQFLMMGPKAGDEV